MYVTCLIHRSSTFSSLDAKWQPLVQPVRKISSKWHFRFSDHCQAELLSRNIFVPKYFVLPVPIDAIVNQIFAFSRLPQHWNGIGSCLRYLLKYFLTGNGKHALCPTSCVHCLQTQANFQPIMCIIQQSNLRSLYSNYLCSNTWILAEEKCYFLVF